MQNSAIDISFEEMFQATYCYDFSQPEFIETSTIRK